MLSFIAGLILGIIVGALIVLQFVNEHPSYLNRNRRQ